MVPLNREIPDNSEMGVNQGKSPTMFLISGSQQRWRV